MTTLSDRRNTALLVVDAQNAAMDRAHDRDAVVGRIRELVNRARRDGIRVIWVQHSDERLRAGSEPWQIVHELVPGGTEPLVHKSYGDAFEDTILEEVLAEHGVGRLVVAGAQTDQCIRSTIHGGFARGYDVTLITDAHTTEDTTQWGAPPPEQVIAHTNLYWRYQSAPGRTAGAVAARDVTW